MSKICFLDSGAFSMAREARKHSNEKKFYRTKRFWDYVDTYAEFIKKWQSSIDYYANVDTSRFPSITWEIQKYLENEHGLKPLPVIHHGEPLKWVEKYVDEGYKYICIGGVAKQKGYSRWRSFSLWGDRVFNMLCPGPDRLPIVKVHGFAITTIPLMWRYPWYSVDSVTWKKMSYYGQILVPPLKGGTFDFTCNPLVIFVDPKSKYTLREGTGKHFLHLPTAGRQHVMNWLEHIKVPFGKTKLSGTVIPGVSNDAQTRCRATIEYFLHLQRHIPKWPWPFAMLERPTLSEALK